MTPQRFTTFKKLNANCLCNKEGLFFFRFRCSPFLDLVVAGGIPKEGVYLVSLNSEFGLAV